MFVLLCSFVILFHVVQNVCCQAISLELTADQQTELIMVLREEQKALREEQLRARENQQQFRDDMSKLLDTIREMTIAVARLEKRPRKEHNPVEA